MREKCRDKWAAFLSTEISTCEAFYPAGKKGLQSSAPTIIIITKQTTL